MKHKIDSELEKTADLQTVPNQKRSAQWIVLILLISGWVFFLGMIVGRGTAPALFDYKKIDSEIQMLAKNFYDSRKANIDMEMDIQKTLEKLEFAKELKNKTDEEVKIQILTQGTPAEAPTKQVETPKPSQQQPTTVQVSPSAPTAPVRPKTSASVKSEPASNSQNSGKTVEEHRINSMNDIVKTSQSRESAPSPAERQQPAAAATPKPQSAVPPAVESKSTLSQPLTIHASSLLDRKSADSLIASLKSKGIQASKTTKMIPGKGVWYQVVIGKFSQSERLQQENDGEYLVKP